MIKAFRRDAMLALLLSIIYRVAVDWGYFHFCIVRYGYYGFEDHKSIDSLVLSWILFFLLYPFFAAILKRGNNRISTIIITALYMLMYIPFTTCVYAGILTDKYIILNLVYWALLLMWSLYKLRREVKPLPTVRFGNAVISDTFLTAFGLFSLALVLFVWGIYGGFRLNFNIFDIYDLRLAAREYSMPIVMSYAFKWTRAINPIMLAYCMVHKKKMPAVCYFAAQMISFNVDGLKSALFMPFVVIVAVKFYHKIPVEKVKYWLVYGVAGASVLSVLEFKTIHTPYIIELFIRRISILTNYICDCYSRFFSENVPDYFRGTLLRPFGFSSPYYDIGKIIGDRYIHAGMNCNSGLFSDAVANLGTLGCFIMPFVVVEVLHIIDRSSTKLDRRITIASGLYISYLLISSFMSTALITHGVLISIILFWIMNDAQEGTAYEI